MIRRLLVLVGPLLALLLVMPVQAITYGIAMGTDTPTSAPSSAPSMERRIPIAPEL